MASVQIIGFFQKKKSVIHPWFRTSISRSKVKYWWNSRGSNLISPTWGGRWGYGKNIFSGKARLKIILCVIFSWCLQFINLSRLFHMFCLDDIFRLDVYHFSSLIGWNKMKKNWSCADVQFWNRWISTAFTSNKCLKKEILRTKSSYSLFGEWILGIRIYKIAIPLFGEWTLDISINWAPLFCYNCVQNSTPIQQP